jgi:hypothetical protein
LAETGNGSEEIERMMRAMPVIVVEKEGQTSGALA